MIDLYIRVNGEKVLDGLKTDDCNLTEVGVALLRLKQIEQVLIDKEFEDDFEVKEDDFIL
jgi:hypothetical protein